MFRRKISKEKLSHPNPLNLPRLIVSALILFVCFIGVGLYLRWNAWALFIFPAIGVALLLGGFLLVRGWFLRRRAILLEKESLSERERKLHPEQLNNVEMLRRQWSEAMRTFRGQGLAGSNEDAIYKSPWFLILGQTGSGKSSFAKAAHPQLPVVNEVSRTENCEWFFFNDSILLDSTGRYVEGKASADEAEWTEFLSLLKQDRKWEPINGVIIAVAADSLFNRELTSLRLEAGQLRKRLDEIVHRLGTKFPVYIIVTKLDKIAGFSEVFQALPDQALDQAMGAVDPDYPAADQLRFFEQAFSSMCQRLEDLTLRLMSKSQNLPVPDSLVIFPQEFKKLQEPLRIYINTLFLQNPYQELPSFRALFFTSARQEGIALSAYSKSFGFSPTQPITARGAREYFVGNILSTILPRDRSLVQRTRFWREEQKVSQAGWLTAALTLGLIVAGLFTLSFSLNSRSLSKLAVDDCLMSRSKTVIRLVREADLCQEGITRLTSSEWWKKPFYHFGLYRTREIQTRLKQRFVEGFQDQVISRLDSKITAQLTTADAASFANILARRIKVMAVCETSKSCPVAAQLKQQDYLRMLQAEDPAIKIETAPDPKEESPADQLKRGYEAVLVWGADNPLISNYRPILTQNLTRWLDKNYSWTDLLLQPLKTQFQNERIKNFWGDNTDLTIEAAYTGKAWTGAIEPFLSAVHEIDSELGPAKDELVIFELDYRNETLRQWQRALSLFAEGSTSVPRTRKEWAFKVMDSNPPEALLKKSFDNVGTLLRGEEDGFPGWLMTLQRYHEVSKIVETVKSSGQEDKADSPSIVSKVEKMLGQKKGDTITENIMAAKYLSAYRVGLAELRDQLVTPKESFQSVGLALIEGTPSEKSKHPILKIQWQLEQLKKLVGSKSEDDEVLWRLLKLPALLYWKAMLNEAGKYLQEEWRKVWVALPDKYQQPGEKARMILAFVTDQAGNFLTRRGNQYVVNEIFGEKVAFRGDFLNQIAQITRYTPETMVDLRFPEEIIQTQ